MKRFYFLSVATLVAGIIGLLSLEATAAPQEHHQADPGPKEGPTDCSPGQHEHDDGNRRSGRLGRSGRSRWRGGRGRRQQQRHHHQRQQ